MRRWFVPLLLAVVLLPPAARAADNPPGGGDVVEAIVRLGTCTRFLAALRAADRVGALRGASVGTVFVPDDDAFAKLPDGTLENLLKFENVSRLSALLDYHRIPGRTRSAAGLATGKLSTALPGAELEIVRAGTEGEPTVNGAHLLRADVPATNGVIHVIDRVLLPPPGA